MKSVLPLLALCAGCHLASLDAFLYAPVKAPAGGYQLSTAVIPSWDELTVPTPDGEQLSAYFVASSGAHPDVTLIYCHGQGGDIEGTWPRIELLYPLGYNLEVFDPRGFGKSTGSPSEPGIDLDVRAVQSELRARRPDDKLVYYGRSLGGALCIEMAAAVNPDVLITESAFASVDELVRDGAYADLPGRFVAESRWDNRGKIAHVGAPYLALHGLADDYVDHKYSIELTDAHRGDTELVLVPGADHSNVPDKMGADPYRQVVGDFINAH